MLDRFLSDVGLTRKDFRYHFTWNGTRYYIPPFKVIWWIVTALLLGAITGVLYVYAVVLSLTLP